LISIEIIIENTTVTVLGTTFPAADDGSCRSSTELRCGEQSLNVEDQGLNAWMKPGEEKFYSC
jgi:hypothetical protein